MIRANSSLAACLAAFLGAGLAARPGAADAASVTGLRLLSVGKADATLSVELDEAASVAVSWGEAPGAWARSAESATPATRHQLVLANLAPDTRVFYQLSVDGAVQPDVFTFRSGRSWVTRRASLLVSADLPQGAGDERLLAERLFAEEGDALLLLGGSPATTPGADAGAGPALAALHSRSMAEKVVALVDERHPTRLDIADVRAVSEGPLPPVDDGACWRVALGHDAPRGAEVFVARGSRPSIATVNGSVHVVLTDPDAAETAPGAARAYVRLDFEEGRLVATLRSADGSLLGREELTRECRSPAPAPSSVPAHSADGDEEPGTSDGDADVSDCGLN